MCNLNTFRIILLVFLTSDNRSPPNVCLSIGVILCYVTRLFQIHRLYDVELQIIWSEVVLDNFKVLFQDFIRGNA
jgi:hypothetical protein